MPFPLPLFPLKLVLFPGAPLPLHIFEPRYRQLLSDCLQGDRRFGITPTPKPGPGAVGCVGYIRLAQPLPDGRSNIVVTGENRFVVRAILDSDKPYLVASVESFEDDPESAPGPEGGRRLRELADRYRSALGLLTDSSPEEPAWAEADPAFSFQIAALLEVPFEVKERMLVQRSTAERARLLLELLPGLIQAAQERAAVHVHARTNGGGGRHPDIVTER